MLAVVRNLLGLIRFSHTVFALPFAFLSAALAWRDEPFRWSLKEGAKGVIVANAAAFQSRYGAGIPVLGTYTGNLDNGGEHLKLVGSFGETIQSFSYKDSWEPQTDGEGFSLEVRDPNQALSLWDDNRGWRSSNSVGGDPNSDVAFVASDSVVVNELAAKVTALSAG